MGVLLEANDIEYTFDCCGSISSWEIYAENQGDVYLQVWRNIGSTWQLVGQNLYTVSGESKLLCHLCIWSVLFIENI